MDNEKRNNIMPVELAIQRELAYRKKVVMLQLQPYNADSWEEFFPLQGPGMIQVLTPSPNAEPLAGPSLHSSSSHDAAAFLRPNLSPTLSGIKRKTPASNLHCIPPQHLQQKYSGHKLKNSTDNLFCMVCLVSCASLGNLQQHLRGRHHKAKQEMELIRKGGEVNRKQRQWCTLCGIWCMDENGLKQHLKGHRHKINLLELENGGGKTNRPQWCELCKIQCMNEDAFEQHLKGQKHIANRQELKDGEEKKKNPQWCDICEIWCINEDSFKQHLKGKKHIMTLYACGVKMTEEEEDKPDSVIISV